MMKKYRSTILHFMQQYNAMMYLARDKASDLYNVDGSQSNGTGVISAFWKGFNGTYAGKFAPLAPAKNTLVYPCYRAGIDFKAEQS